MSLPIYSIALNIALASLIACTLALAYNRLVSHPFSRHRYLSYWAAIVVCLVCPLPIIAMQTGGIGWMKTAEAPATATTIETNETNGAPTVRASEAIEIDTVRDSGNAVVSSSERLSAGSMPRTTTVARPAKRVSNIESSLDESRQRSYKATLLASLPVGLIGMWIFGALAGGWRLLSEVVYLRRISRSLRETTFAYGDLIDELNACCGYRPTIQQSQMVSAPLTYGWLRPVIVVPVGIEGVLDRQQLLAVLLHECGHVARHDTRATVVQAIVGCLFWWNPFVHCVNNRVHAIREILCDDYVRLVAGLQESLARGMVELAERAVAEPGTSLCTRFFGNQQTIQLRIQRLMNADPKDVPRSTHSGLLAGSIYAALLMAVCIPVFVPVAQLATAQEKPLPQDQGKDSDGIVAGSVRDSDGNPLKDISVWMLVIGRGAEQGQELLVQTKTDVEGLFEFKTKQSGHVNLAATGPSWSWAAKHVFEVKPNQRLSDNNLVLTPARKVQLEIEDEQGKPIEQVELEQVGWTVGEKGIEWLLRRLVDGSGLGMPVTHRGNTLVIDKLPEDASITAGVAAPDYALSRVKIGEDNKQTKKVILRRGYPLHVKLRKSPSQEPIANHPVTIVYYDHDDLKDVLFRSQKVDSDGNCKFMVPHAHHLSVRVDHPQYVSRTWHQFTEWGNHPTEKTVTLELCEKGKVRGRVIEKETREPAANTNVGIIISPGQIFTSANTDADGYYEIEGAVGPAEVLPSWGHGYYIDEDAKIKVELKAGEVVQATEDIMIRKIPPITGLVTSGGQPVENAIVFTSMSSTPAVSDRDGRFTFSIPNDGLQFLEAVHLPGDASGSAAVSREMIGQKQPIQIELKPNCEIRGRIADWNGQDKTPREIYLYRQIFLDGAGQTSNAGVARINAQGEFSFKGLNPAFQYKVSPRLLDHGNKQLPWISLNQPVVELEPLRGLELAEASRFDRISAAIAFDRSRELSCTQWHNSAPLSLQQMKGQVVLLHFFNSKQNVSHGDLRLLNALYEAYSAKGFVVIGVHRNSESFDKAVQLVNSLDVRFPIAQDDESGASAKYFDLGVNPASYLIDKTGRIHWPVGQFEEKIRQIEEFLAE